MHVNKVSCVRTIDRVAKDLGEDVDFLFDVAIEMEPEDGLIWVLGLGDESVMAFSDDGVDSLVELIKSTGKRSRARSADLGPERQPPRPMPDGYKRRRSSEKSPEPTPAGPELVKALH